MIGPGDVLFRLVAALRGGEGAVQALSVLNIDPALAGGGSRATRAQVAMALNIVLFADLLERAPTGAAYVGRCRAQGRRIRFDHGALRTVDGPIGHLPCGHTAFSRLLEPLGYEIAGLYPLPSLNMTGRAYAHHDFPETVPQFFVSELHVRALPEEARTAAHRIFGASADPLGDVERQALRALAEDRACPLDTALILLPGLVRAFGRHHPPPALADYEALRGASPEGAWIATEGNAFNHATDRVADVVALARQLRAEGLPLKPEVEVSANGRVRQTAFLADRVLRPFRLDTGEVGLREVPGSFFELISRDVAPATGRLDLSFDSGNATGIFAVTVAP